MAIFAISGLMFNTIKDFFIDEKARLPFHLFGILHIALILFVVSCFVLIYCNRNRIIQMSEEKKKRLRYFVAIVMFINMAIYYGSLIYYGTYDWKADLPLHLCFISGYLYMLGLVTNSKKIYKVTYFLAFIGPLPAILWPDLVTSVDSFVFYQYIFSHHLFLISSFFFYYAYNVKIGKKDLWRIFFIANGIFIIMTGFNYLFDTNYIMSSEIPPHILKLYPFVKNFNYPIIVMELTGLIVFMLAYIPVYFRNKENNVYINEKL